MTEKIIDFQAGKDEQLHKRKEAKLDAMRNAFRLARKEGVAAKAPSKSKKRRKTKK